MKTIWKFDALVDDNLVLEMPSGAQILHVGKQPLHGIGEFAIWALVDPEMPPYRRRLIMRGTGHPMPDEPVIHLATILDGQFVWHLFSPDTEAKGVES